MTAHASAPASPRALLAAITVLVIGAHAWLVLGLPSFTLPRKPSGAAPSLLTRMVAAPAAPAPEPSPPEARPAEAPPPAPTPAATPRPKPQPRPKPKPKPRPRKPAPATTAAAAAPDSAAAPVSLLSAPPIGSFGGGTIERHVTPLFDDADTDAALAAISQRGEAGAPVQPAPAAHLRFDVRIEARGDRFAGSSSLIWRQDGRLYDANWTFFSPRLGQEDSSFSSGLVTPAGLAPLYTRLTRGRDQTREMRFDHAAGQLQAETPLDLPPGTQDRLSALLQLGALFAADPGRYPVGSAVTVTVASPDAVGDWRFAIEAEESLQALGGTTVQALRVVHHPRQADAPRIEAWLAPRMAYLPVRLRLTHPDGSTIDHVAREAIALPMQPPPARRKPSPPRPAEPATPPEADTDTDARRAAPDSPAQP